MSLLPSPALEAESTLWITFGVAVIAMLAIDLGLHRKAHALSAKESAIWSGVWIAVAGAFNVFVYFRMGHEKALEFLVGYALEKSLSVDNMFIFILIFSSLNIPDAYQPKVLKWGIIGALVMRAILIFVGASLLETFHWMIYVFGAIIMATGIRMIIQKEKKIHPERNPLVRLARKIMPVTSTTHGEKFFVRLNGVMYATPLWLALLVVETTDLIFAVDSIPAIFAITSDLFIVYTSNIFAILGLRALYFLLANMMLMFSYLKVALSVILFFIGMKMVLSDVYKISIEISLLVIFGILGFSILLSFFRKSQQK